MRKGLNFIAILFFYFSCTTTPDKGDRQEGATDLNWTESYPGIWRATSGDPDPHNFINLAGKKPKITAIEKLGAHDFPLDRSEIHVTKLDGKTYISLPLQKGEEIYGLGLNFKTVHQRGRIMRLHVDHYGNEDNGRTHAPVPFYVSSRGYGVLINAARYLDIYVGTGVRKDSPEAPEPRDRNLDPLWTANPYSDAVEILIPSDKADLLIFEGDTPLKAVQRFNLFFGGGVIPPKWGLGFWQRTPTLYSDDDVMREISEFKSNDFPIDVIGLEPGWHSKSYPCTFEWDETRFPAPQSFIEKTGKEGVRINLWCNPYLSPEAPIHAELKDLSGSHTVWGGIVPDFNIDRVREVYGNHLMKNQVALGVSGFKVDEVDGFDEWLWPDVATFPSGISAEQIRQTYGLQFLQLATELYEKNNVRTYGLARANNAGGVSLPYVLYNDQYSHRDYITGLINSGFCGVLWTPEVRSSNNAEDWLRRMQTTCFSPLAMINAWASGTKPWSFPEVYDACREVALLRMQLLPYIYSAFARYHFEGLPPFRAMALEVGYRKADVLIEGKLHDTDNPYNKAVLQENKSQYMMGDFIMVAPLFAGMSNRDVVLPEGNWYDFYTGAYAGNGEVIHIEPPMERIPLFVKEGGIIPMMPPVRQTSEWKEGTPLTVRVYGKEPGAFVLYDDDGVSFNYQDNKYTRVEFSVKDGKGQTKKIDGSGPWSYGEPEWVFMTKL